MGNQLQSCLIERKVAGLKLRITIAMLAIYLIWGSTYLAIRFAVETIPPFLMAAVRFLVPGLILVIWKRASGDPAPSGRQWLSAVTIGLFLLLAGNGLLSWAEKRIDSGIASLLIGTVPIWMVLIDTLLISKRKPRLGAIIGLLTGFAGIVILVGPRHLLTGEGHYDLVGFAVTLLAALFWSFGSVISRKANLPSSPLLATGMEMLGGSAGLFLVSLIGGEWHSFHISAVASHSWFGLLYLIIAGSLGGFVAYTWLLRNAPISLIATYAYVNPIVAILLGYFFAGEQLTSQVLVSALIIIGSVILINNRRI
jgi:drug/metabolite transporter (DMT)-like permease